MKMYLVALFDKSSEMFQAPMMVPAPGVAMRYVGDMVNGAPSQENTIAAHPEDFELYHIGTFDNETCQLEGLLERLSVEDGDGEEVVNRRLLCRCVDLKK